MQVIGIPERKGIRNKIWRDMTNNFSDKSWLKISTHKAGVSVNHKEGYTHTHPLAHHSLPVKKQEENI